VSSHLVPVLQKNKQSSIPSRTSVRYGVSYGLYSTGSTSMEADEALLPQAGIGSRKTAYRNCVLNSIVPTSILRSTVSAGYTPFSSRTRSKQVGSTKSPCSKSTTNERRVVVEKKDNVHCIDECF
jgi:hypothetical protein